MNEKKKKTPYEYIAAGINKVFEHRKNFLVIGLTGRTGSGCSTAANILTSQYGDLCLPTVQNPPKTHEDRKLRIVRLWAEKHWYPFSAISVTALILALVLERGVSEFCELVRRADGKLDTRKLNEDLMPYEAEIKHAFLVCRDLHSNQYTASDIAKAVTTFTDSSVRALDVVKSAMKHYGADYTTVFQTLGNNVRCSGSPLSRNVSMTLRHRGS